jgi:nicotinate phosphoribosyltransferase
VRLDTSEKLIDKSLQEDATASGLPSMYRGVCPDLVRNVRGALDDMDYPDVKIVVSGGFDVEKINRFERSSVPVDAYGIGSSLIRGSNDFTADVVENGGKPCAKVGRERIHSDRLEAVA